MAFEKRDLLKGLLTSTQEKLLGNLGLFLADIYGDNKMIIENEYIIAIGEDPVGLVAHLDTVVPEPIKEIYYDANQNAIWAENGLGADDRAGVFAILELIHRGSRPTVIFTTDEEKGGLGASALVADIPVPVTNLKYLIELDRRGKDDSVFYECDNEDFERYVNCFGFTTSLGSFSDISFICPVWEVAGVNLSIGYYNEHTKDEYLMIDEMMATIDKVECMIRDAASQHKFKYIPMESIYNFFSSTMNDDHDLCWGCLEIFPEYLLIPVGRGFYCSDCYTGMFAVCEECNTSFHQTRNEETVCSSCRGESNYGF